jgi:pSer/pThr/pTyr-binding forkhead associated (FHA) protein
MRLILRIISGPLAGTEVVAENDKTISVGRTKKSDFATEDNFMSSRHFAVECGTDACRIRDLKSRNGTTLNGKTVTEAVLKNGDKIAAGHLEFLVTIDSEPAKSDQDKRFMETLRPIKSAPPLEVPAPAISKPPDPVKPQSRRDREEFSKTADKEALAPITQSPPVSDSTKKSESTSPQVLSTPYKKPPESKPKPPPLASTPVPPVIDAYTAATPEGRLLQLLSSQAEPLMGLLDATDDPKVLELLRNSGEEYKSIYQDEKSAAIAPYLVSLPPHSALLKRLIHDGWGKGWGVYLTCGLPLQELRRYFRHALMVTMPDGVELFSRFYAPAFFRRFLETSTRAEVERFFGPITAYLMEAEKPEILLEFTRSSEGVEKRGHLLSTLE